MELPLTRVEEIVGGPGGDVKGCGHFESSITEEINDKGFEFGGLVKSFEGLVEIWVVEAWN